MCHKEPLQMLWVEGLAARCKALQMWLRRSVAFDAVGSGSGNKK
jgi:hypothetical protein